MKKQLLLLTTLFSFGLNAQNFIEPNTVSNESYKSKIESFKENNFTFDFTQLNQGQVMKSLGNDSDELIIGRNVENDNLDPFATLNTHGWGSATNISTGESVIYSTKSKFNADAYLDFTLHNDDLSVDKNFRISIPTTANDVRIINEFATNLFTDYDGLVVPVFIHFFEGGTGPNFRKSQVWFISEEGNILRRVDAQTVNIKKDVNNNLNVFSYLNFNENVTTTKLDLSNPENDIVYTYPSTLLRYYSGVPLVYKTIDGVDYIVLLHYDQILVNNSTLEFNQNASLIIEFRDFETFSVQKTISLPVKGFNPEDPYSIPMATFGMFYQNDKYDISTNIFDTDDQYEIVYGSYIYNMLHDKEWYNYFVINEDREVIHSFDQYIHFNGLTMGANMQEIPNLEDQVVMLEGIDEGITNVKIYNLPSLTLAQDFPASHNGDILTLNMNRIPAEDSFNYVIGLRDIEAGVDKKYGIIKHYSPTGAEVEKVRLPLSNATDLTFNPILTSVTLRPTLFNNDQNTEYVYVYSDKFSSPEPRVNNFVIAQNENNVLASFSGRTSNGNITSAGILNNRAGVYDRMYIHYGGTSSNTDYLTEFYSLPLQTLAVNDAVKHDNTIQYLYNTKQLIFDQEVSFQVYNMVGNVVKSAKKVITSNLAELTQGVYVVKAIDAKGKVYTKKILVK